MADFALYGQIVKIHNAWNYGISIDSTTSWNKPPDFHLNTSDLWYRPQEKILFNRVPVAISQENSETNAIGMHGEFRKRNSTIARASAWGLSDERKPSLRAQRSNSVNKY